MLSVQEYAETPITDEIAQRPRRRKAEFTHVRSLTSKEKVGVTIQTRHVRRGKKVKAIDSSLMVQVSNSNSLDLRVAVSEANHYVHQLHADRVREEGGVAKRAVALATSQGKNKNIGSPVAALLMIQRPSLKRPPSGHI